MGAERQDRLHVMLRLLRDAGADDLAECLSVEAAELVYLDVVHAVQRVAAEWRASRALGDRRSAFGTRKGHD